MRESKCIHPALKMPSTQWSPSSRSSRQGRQDRLPQSGWQGRQLRAGAGQAAVQSKKISSVDNSWGTYCFVPAGTRMRAKDLFSQSGSWLQVQHSWSPWPNHFSLCPQKLPMDSGCPNILRHKKPGHCWHSHYHFAAHWEGWQCFTAASMPHAAMGRHLQVTW